MFHLLGIQKSAAANNEEKNSSGEVLSNSPIRVNGNRIGEVPTRQSKNAKNNWDLD